MFAIKARGGEEGRGTHRGRGTDALDAAVLDQLEWIASTAATHRAAARRLAGAQGDDELREAAYEEALTAEMHRAAISRLDRMGANCNVSG